MFKFLSFITLVFICSSCTNTRGSNSNMHEKLLSTDTVKYAYNTLIENSQYFISNDDDIDTTYFKITYPVFEKDSINDKIRQYILIDGEKTPSEAASSFIDGYDEFVGDLNESSFHVAWFKEINSHVILNTPILVSLSTQIVEYSGGAHGQHYNIYSNYDLRKNKAISLSEIVNKENYQELTKIAEKIFRQQENISDSTSLSKDFFFEDGIFTLNDNFGLTKEALVIFFNEYEIRPYAYGGTKLEIPYKYLNGIFNNSGQEYIQSIL